MSGASASVVFQINDGNHDLNSYYNDAFEMEQRQKTEYFFSFFCACIPKVKNRLVHAVCALHHGSFLDNEDEDGVAADFAAFSPPLPPNMGNPKEYLSMALKIGVFMLSGVSRIKGRKTSRLMRPVIVPLLGWPNAWTSSVARKRQTNRASLAECLARK